MKSTDIRRRVETLLARFYPPHDDAEGAEIPFLGENGLFDSVAALELVLELEKEFAIVVRDGEIKPENLKNLESLVRFVSNKVSS